VRRLANHAPAKLAESDFWLARSDHTVTCDFEDLDCNLETGELESDDVICTWTGASGSFKNGNVGESVEYICIDTSGADWVDVTCVDAGTLAPDYWEPAYDSVTFSTIIPAIDYVEFAGTYALHDVSVPEWLAARDGQAAKDEPFVYKRSTVAYGMSAEIKGWHATSLTEGTDVCLKGSATFGSHDAIALDNDSYSAATFGTSWPSAVSQPLANSLSALWDTVEKNSGSITWHYAVQSGSNNWIALGSSPHGGAGDEKMVTVWDVHQCPDAEYTKEHVLDSAGYADHDETSNTEPNVAENVCRNVWDQTPGGCICPNSAPGKANPNAKSFAYHMDACKGQFPPETPDTLKGLCCCRAYGMICVLEVLGVGSYVQDFVNEHPEGNNRRRHGDQVVPGWRCLRREYDHPGALSPLLRRRRHRRAG